MAFLMLTSLQFCEFRFRQTHVQQFLPDMLIAGFGFEMASSVFDQFPFGHDIVRPELFCAPEGIFSNVRLGFCHKVFFYQLIELQTAHGHERLTFFDAITQLDMNLFNLSLDPRCDHRHLLEIERDFARCYHRLRDRAYRDGIGFETLSDGVRRVKWPGMSRLRL